MNPRRGLLTYLIALPVFFAIDMIWLGWLSGDLYQQRIGHLLGPVNWTAAVVFYLVFIAGILIFAVRPGLASGSPRSSALWGGLFGFFTYATYGLTNLATLKGWPADLVAIDILWGTVLCASVAFLTCLIAGKTLRAT